MPGYVKCHSNRDLIEAFIINWFPLFAHNHIAHCIHCTLAYHKAVNLQWLLQGMAQTSQWDGPHSLLLTNPSVAGSNVWVAQRTCPALQLWPPVHRAKVARIPSAACLCGVQIIDIMKDVSMHRSAPYRALWVVIRFMWSSKQFQLL